MQMQILLCLLPFCGGKTILSDWFIHDINTKNSTWTAGQNFPKNTPVLMLAKLNGAREDPELYDVEIKTHNITEEIPESFDSKENWARCESIGKIRNQGFCGSCWAFGAAETMSDRLCIATNATQKFQFSPEHLLSCCKDCGHGCNGGYSSKAWEFWVHEGIVSGGDHESFEGCQPYSKQAFQNSTTPECNSQCSNKNYQIPFEKDRKFGVSNFRLPSEIEQIQYEIMVNGPVQATYAVFEDFYLYKSGVYQHVKGAKSGYHAVKIIGWGVDRVPYWLVANSWGPKWGDSGFFKILRGQNHCGIEGNVLGGLPKIESGQ